MWYSVCSDPNILTDFCLFTEASGPLSNAGGCSYRQWETFAALHLGQGPLLPSPRRLASEGIVVVGVCVCVCVCVSLSVCLSATPRLQARRISLRGEGNALYPVLCIQLLMPQKWKPQMLQQMHARHVRLSTKLRKIVG